MGSSISVVWDTCRRRICGKGVGVVRDRGLERVVTRFHEGSSTRTNCGGSAFDLKLLHVPPGVEKLGLQGFAGREGCLPGALVLLEHIGPSSRKSQVLAVASLGLEGDCKSIFPAAKCVVSRQSLMMSALKGMSFVRGKDATVIYLADITLRLNDSLNCWSFVCDLALITQSGPVEFQACLSRKHLVLRMLL